MIDAIIIGKEYDDLDNHATGTNSCISNDNISFIGPLAEKKKPKIEATIVEERNKGIRTTIFITIFFCLKYKLDN